MEVLYDHQAFQMQNHGGVSRGFAEVISRLSQNGVSWDIAIKDSKNVYLKESLADIKLSGKFLTLSTFCKDHSFPGRGRLYKILDKYKLIRNSFEVNQKYALSKIKEGNYDVFHPTFFDTYFLREVNFISNKPIVLTIHDMIPELFPGEYVGSTQAHDKKKLIKFATNVIVPTNNTKKDVVRILKYPEERIRVIHWGADLLPQGYLEGLQRLIPHDYLLYVGNRQGYKGFQMLIKEFFKIRQLHPNMYLVCTGKPFTENEKNMISNLNLAEYIIQRFANQRELHSFYRYAKAFVYPSLYEGFGIPIYEAYACQCPVFLNDKSCFREVGGDAAIYFNQDMYTSDFAGKFDEFISKENDYRAFLIPKEIECIKNASWDKTAKQYADFYKSLV